MEKGIVIGGILFDDRQNTTVTYKRTYKRNAHVRANPHVGMRRNTEADYIFWTITFSDVLSTLPKLTLVGSMVMPICQSVLPVLSVRLRVS